MNRFMPCAKKLLKCIIIVLQLERQDDCIQYTAAKGSPGYDTRHAIKSTPVIADLHIM